MNPLMLVVVHVLNGLHPVIGSGNPEISKHLSFRSFYHYRTNFITLVHN